MDHRNISTHAVPIASGRTVAPGDTATLDLDDQHDASLVEDGLMTPVETDTDYEHMRLEQLQSLAAEHGWEVDGTGKDGAVVKADLVKAAHAHLDPQEA